jgi:hypothetical protein
MAKTVVIRITKSGSRLGVFSLFDDRGNTLATDVSKENLIDGYTVSVDDRVQVIVVKSVGLSCCGSVWNIPIGEITVPALAAIQYEEVNTASLWRHLTNPEIYNTFYGCINPYIIEYPFAYQYFDEILQNVKDYTKAYKYLPSEFGVFDDSRKVETDDQYFNKAVLYNGQQSSGILELVPKPMNNLKEYLKYPMYNADSKTITFTKSDNFYQYNTFWSLVKNKSIPLFITSCESMSIDKIVNQSNMDYGKRSFKKEPLRAKELKVRHILDNKSNAHLVSQFIFTPAQISYK